MKIKTTPEQREQARQVLAEGVEKAEVLVELQFEAARRLLRSCDLADNDENAIKVAQIVATTWAGME